jgi:hypothetical protein
MSSIAKSGALTALAATVCLSIAQAATAAQGVQISQLADRLRVEINGQLFTEYYFKDVPRPFCYPVLGPGNLPMTRNWPMKEAPDEERDHKHHRSLWFTHGAVNGHDFWSEDKQFGKIVHERFDQVKSGADVGIIQARNNWIAADGSKICRDEQTLRIYSPRTPAERMLDFEITIYALDKDLTFGDTKEGSMAIRLAETMRLKGKVGKGHIVNSKGVKDGDTWGKRAEWCDYYGPVEGKTVGVAIFDHPTNPRHPTTWHVRQYGLFAANPFGLHDFERSPDRTKGNLTIPAGKSVTFRYRFYMHEGDEKQAKVAERYDQYKWTDRIHDGVGRPVPKKTDDPFSPPPKEKK